MKTKITIQTIVNAPANKVWEYWNEPRHIVKWNHASDDWHSPHAQNDLQKGGKFSYRMEARDGSVGFDFTGKYVLIELHNKIVFLLDDDRRVDIQFKEEDNKTIITETFETEDMNSAELQRTGWQAILDNFKQYAESHFKNNTIHYEIAIAASRAKIWDILLSDNTYPKWTKVFNPESHFKGSWEKGAKIHFIGLDENGQSGGMVSRVIEHVKNEYVCIETIGLLKEGVEILSGPELEPWLGGHESYRLREIGGKTILSVDLEIVESFRSYFEETWPQALEIIKKLSEQK